MIKSKVLSFFNYGIDKDDTETTDTHGIDKETLCLVNPVLAHVNKDHRKLFLKRVRSSQKLNPDLLKNVLIYIATKKKPLHFLDGFLIVGA